MVLLLAMATFALALSITPGPVNMISLTSGVNNGLWRTLPFVSGATVGFTLLLFVIGVGGDILLKNYPLAMQVMKVLGTGFIFYIGWMIFKSDGQLQQQETRLPRFMEGAVLQWLNPKAWIACVSGVGAFVSGEGLGTIYVFCAIYFVLCYAGLGFWALMGASAQTFLTTAKRLRLFNRIMGAGLCLVAVYLLLN